MKKNASKTIKIVGASTVKAEDVLSGKVASAFSRAEQAIPKQVVPQGKTGHLIRSTRQKGG